MKIILVQLGKTVLMLIACIIQFVSLVFQGIEWVFGKAGELMSDASIWLATKAKTKKEKISEEVAV